LLRTLYYEAELVLTDGFPRIPHTQYLENARLKLAGALGDWDEEQRRNYLDLHAPNY